MNLYFDCWTCGKPVLLVAGYTMKRDAQGNIIAICPWCAQASSAKTLTGRVARRTP